MNPAGKQILDMATFERGDVDPDAFDHAAHVHVAWQYLDAFDLDEALRRFSTALRALTVKLGVPDKYHATITWFFMILISERMARDPDADWRAFSAANADLIESAGTLLAAHYSSERLNSVLARHQFLMPDRGVLESAA